MSERTSFESGQKGGTRTLSNRLPWRTPNPSSYGRCGSRHPNQKKNGAYTPLETPTASQAALISKYSPQSIPFIDFGNKYGIAGASYSSDPLVGKSFDEIAAASADPSTDIGKSVLGTANVFTATICNVTDGKPGSVCNDPTITKLRSILNAEKEISVTAGKELVLVAGNAGGIEVSYNGKPIAPLGKKKQLRKVTFTPRGVQQ